MSGTNAEDFHSGQDKISPQDPSSPWTANHKSLFGSPRPLVQWPNSRVTAVMGQPRGHNSPGKVNTIGWGLMYLWMEHACRTSDDVSGVVAIVSRPTWHT